MGEKTLRRTDTQELHATATTCAEPYTIPQLFFSFVPSVLSAT